MKVLLFLAVPRNTAYKYLFTILLTWVAQVSVESIWTRRNLKEVTLCIMPTFVVRSGGLDLASDPRIISLVLEAFSCMSLFSVQSSKFLKKFNMSDLEEFGCRASDKVENLAKTGSISQYRSQTRWKTLQKPEVLVSIEV